MRLVFLAALLVACSGAPKPAHPTEVPPPRDDGGIDVTLTTADGVKLAATHWIGPASRDRCVVLVHQLGSTRDEWAPLVARLRGHYEILSLDLRGHGDSRRGPRGDVSYRHFSTADWEGAVRDLEAATAWLGERGYRDRDCVYIGSSIGSSLVVRFAGAHPDAGGVVLLSPGLAYKGVAIEDAAARYAGPALVIYSGEPGMKETVDRLGALWGAAMQRVELEGTSHGVSMIADDRAKLDLVSAFVGAITAAP